MKINMLSLRPWFSVREQLLPKVEEHLRVFFMSEGKVAQKIERRIEGFLEWWGHYTGTWRWKESWARKLPGEVFQAWQTKKTQIASPTGIGNSSTSFQRGLYERLGIGWSSFSADTTACAGWPRWADYIQIITIIIKSCIHSICLHQENLRGTIQLFFYFLLMSLWHQKHWFIRFLFFF